MLEPGGWYFAQHVGPHSLRSLSEFLMGPQTETSKRHPNVEQRVAREAGLVVHTMEVERLRTVFFDVGAVVYFLRLVPWIVPGFTVRRYRNATPRAPRRDSTRWPLRDRRPAECSSTRRS